MHKFKKTAAYVLSMLAAGAVMTVNAFAESAPASSGQQQEGGSTAAALLFQVGPLVLILVLFYFVLLRPQQKREKEAQAMREAVAVGDEVCTAGGIVGIVLKVEEDTVVLETGAERNRIRIKKWAIHENITQIEAQQAAERERKAARQRGISTAAADTDSKKKKDD
ncbi:MAG: preprotein translocase subunit YajC [Oscillospiraceae bacterium]|nr:preprotein translocase subunit YajC [Oscillospiraceae bacterium]